ncbi:MAG: Lsm family RNA-binding protein [Candidatus Bathyarchaeia archaeon]|nr:Lsm family RNA-binding protein [Candidatus Bathyarchaeota archaeon]
MFVEYYSSTKILAVDGAMSTAERRFVTEISALIDKTVSVLTVDGKTYTGILVGIDPESLSLCLLDARDQKGQVIPKIVLSGSRVAEILSIEKPFDLKGLAERLERVFPKMVKLYEKEGFIWVMDRIKVTQNGVVEGTGPAAERVQKVYQQFVQEMKGG